jgi:hypothetical protein
VCRPATEKKKENQNQTLVASLASTHGVDLLSTKVDTYQQSQFTDRHRETVRGGSVSGCGVSAAWMPRPSPQGWVYGVPATRHRPAQQTEKPEPLWLWLLL